MISNGEAVGIGSYLQSAMRGQQGSGASSQLSMGRAMSGSGGSGHDGAGQVDHARPWTHGSGHQFPAWQCGGWAGCGYRFVVLVGSHGLRLGCRSGSSWEVVSLHVPAGPGLQHCAAACAMVSRRRWRRRSDSSLARGRRHGKCCRKGQNSAGRMRASSSRATLAKPRHP